ncbi:M67 family metallopeptidase [Sphingomonas fennica]|uniref:MPN domain-containing protein n=1 Tax=Edaphosphingomonas fennica TaxID=114404 RepID=A0A2T4I5Z5_9SPHN|nr:M67 family metallopeptidase [Sphingomonas fennica]PTD26066.1 hypothetical protein CV103_03360 [Sphingomonas fennica]
MKIAIARRLLAQIIDHAAADPEKEVCGLLFGDGTEIAAARPAANVHPDPASFFEVDPVALFAALRGERAGGKRLIGHYHSHPRGPAFPSVEDAAAADPSADRLWLIVAGGEAACFRAHRGGEIHDCFDRVTLSVHD